MNLFYRTLALVYIGVLSLITFSSCKDDNLAQVSVYPTSLIIRSTGGFTDVKVNSNTDWSISFSDDWGSASVTVGGKGQSFVRLSFPANPDTLYRQQTITFRPLSSEYGKATIAVKQNPKNMPDEPDEPDDPDDPEEPEEPDDPDTPIPDTLILACDTPEFACVGGTGTLTLKSNVAWTMVASDADWCTIESLPSQGEKGTFILPFTVQAWDGAMTRTARLTFKTVNDSLSVLEIQQRRLGITTPKDLMLLALMVNQDEELKDWMDADSVVHLYSDLDMSGYDFIPIGKHVGTQFHSFKGTFEGNNHTIDNIRCVDSDSKDIGLFGYMFNALVQNVNLGSGCLFEADAKQGSILNIGSICGWNYGGNFDNCASAATVKVNYDDGTLYEMYVGGLVGVNYRFENSNLTPYITRSTYSGTVSGKANVGGIVGRQVGGVLDKCTTTGSAKVTGFSITGGICGNSSNASGIEDCINNATVTALNALGGICGWQYSDSYLLDCTNNGSVVPASLTDSEVVGIGGICGSSTSAYVENCTNTVALQGVVAVGGICGESSGTYSQPYTQILKCTNLGPVTGDSLVGGICGALYNGTGKIDQCINMTAAAVKGRDLVGGICGSVTYFSATISDSKNYAPVSSDYYAGGIVATTSGDVSDCVNFGNVTTPVGSIAEASQESGSTAENAGDTSIDDNEVTGSGGIAALGMASFSGCSNQGVITGANAGGIVAWFNSTGDLIDECTNSGAVTGTFRAGGIVASNPGRGSVSGCTNTATIEGSMYVAGIAGANYRGNFTDCINEGAVNGSEMEGNLYFFAGGIIGHNTEGNLTDCNNSGAVTRRVTTGASKYVGGICAYTRSTRSDSVTPGILKNCVNTGTITGYHDMSQFVLVGGICGFFYSGTRETTTTSSGLVVRNLPDGTTVSGTDSDFWIGDVW